MLHSLWNAWTWLPAWARVLSAALAWMGFAEVIALFCAIGTRLDRQIDGNEWHRASRALSHGARLRSGSGTVR